METWGIEQKIVDDVEFYMCDGGLVIAPYFNEEIVIGDQHVSEITFFIHINNWIQ